ncbi:ImmA/IrrE family metallo-endopeptidase [Candidatus Poriferisodalis sp.]|uniref:ImmA/IrrE family metallo-endopeptidase n=1 Tax=Candidatus Poriferisodalis sp. TaxID=3101277 RepID=UPI003B5193FD
MDELVARSSGGELEFSLTWLNGGAKSTGAEATFGNLRVCLRGRPVWHGEDDTTGFEWTWIELLEFLGEYWLYLSVEDGCPFGVAPNTAPRMFAAAEAAIEMRPSSEAEYEREQLEAYRLTHDLAEALQGVVSPPLWVVRDGNVGWMASTAMTATVPFEEMLDVLTAVGDFISLRLNGLGDERSIQAVQTWRERDHHDRLRVIEAATGYPPELVAEVETAFPSQDDSQWSTPASDELLAAARLVGPQPLASLRPILDAVRQAHKVETSELDHLSEQASEVIARASDEPPYVQGYELADWLRSQPGIVGANGRVNPDHVLRLWRVPVIDVGLGLIDVDAIGCWGPSHGPAVLVNSDRRHATNSGRRRATLAHEICHLFADRSTSLPLVEVLGGRTAKHVEQRARAFAAEFLLPRRLAGEAFMDVDGDDERAAKSLRARFGVSSALLGWQVRNSAVFLRPKSRQFVDRLIGDQAGLGWF